MKNLYYNTQKFMFRIPNDVERKLDFTEEEIKNACLDAKFREKVSIASPALVDMMDLYIKNPEKLSEKKLVNFQNLIMKYLIRSKNRTTPFGLFSGVGLGKFGDSDTFDVSGAKYQKKVNIDSEWLFGFISQLEKIKSQRLRFKINDACYIKGNRAILLYSTEKEIEEISVRATRVFEIIYESCQEFKEYNQIARIIEEEYPNVPNEKVTFYLNELISKEILISDLRPSLNSRDQIAYVIERLRESALFEEAGNIIEISKMCTSYMNLPVGEGITLYDKIVSKMKLLYSCSSYLQVDTVIENAVFEIKSTVANKINRLASFFVYISNDKNESHTYLDEYRNKFIEKYGVDREVPLLEMLDSNIGIGAPTSYLNPQNDFFEEDSTKPNYNLRLKNYLLNKYESAITNKTSITLEQDEIEGILKREIKTDEVPISLELYFQLKKKNDELNLCLGPNCGSFVAGKTFGRFSTISDEFADMLEDINKEERRLRDDNIEMCEIGFLPAPARNGNIVRTRTFREKKTVIFTAADKGTTDVINIKDISIGVFNELFYARDYKTKKLVVFESNNMYNPMLNPNILRFLQDISHEGKRSWSEFPWTYIFSEFRHVPAIKFEDIVIENEKWKLNLSEMRLEKKNFEEFKCKFLQLIKDKNIPDDIYLTEADNRIKLDLKKELSIRIIFDEFKKHGSRDLILERAEAGENITYSGEGGHTTEIVVPLFRKEKELQNVYPAEKVIIERKKHLELPFENWLYFNLYCNSNREDELIAFDIMDFCEELKKKYDVDYFFMRYVDPKPHVRLRIKGTQEVLLQIYPLIIKWQHQLLDDGIIGDLKISIYDREIERYGGLHLMDIAEQVFFIDSFIVESILRMKRLGVLAMDQEDIAIISIIMYTQGFYETFEEQMNFLAINYHTSDFMSEFKKKKQRLVSLCGCENDWKELLSNEEGTSLYNLLNMRTVVLNKYRDEINNINQDPLFKNGIVASVIHLHCNRIIGTDRELERKLMAFSESIMYAKRYIMKRNEDHE